MGFLFLIHFSWCQVQPVPSSEFCQLRCQAFYFHAAVGADLSEPGVPPHPPPRVSACNTFHNVPWPHGAVLKYAELLKKQTNTHTLTRYLCGDGSQSWYLSRFRPKEAGLPSWITRVMSFRMSVFILGTSTTSLLGWNPQLFWVLRLIVGCALKAET